MTEQEISVKLTETEQRVKSNTHRIEKLEQQQKDLNKLVTAVEVLASREKGRGDGRQGDQGGREDHHAEGRKALGCDDRPRAVRAHRGGDLPADDRGELMKGKKKAHKKNA